MDLRFEWCPKQDLTNNIHNHVVVSTIPLPPFPALGLRAVRAFCVSSALKFECVAGNRSLSPARVLHTQPREAAALMSLGLQKWARLEIESVDSPEALCKHRVLGFRV